jgi:uroporphyrinogen decarboxylase
MIMSPEVTHRNRLEACMNGDFLDHLPVALWRHFPVADQTPDLLAKMVLDFQAAYDFDLIKVTPASTYCLRDWGSYDRWAGNPEGTRDHTNQIIQHPDDWLKLAPLDPKRGELGKSLEALRLIKSGNSTQAPILQTIFNPLSQAKNLAGHERLIYHLRSYPEMVMAGLDIITETILRYLDEVQKLGVDGIFYAIQHAQYQLLSVEEFQKFSRPYDLKILNHLDGFWMNMLHLHGEHVMFNEIADYPVQIINWHDRESEISLEGGLKQFSGVACGGIRRLDTMLLGAPDQVQEEIKSAAFATGKKRLIIGTGCVLMTTTPLVNIEAACKAVKDLH